MLFVDPDTVIDVPLYSQLSRMGFRRNGNFLYTPRCGGCALCLASRVDVQRFKRNRSQRRCWTKNADVVIDQLASIDMAEHYEVYSAYIAQRHSDGDMYPPSMKQFEDYLGRPWECTSYLEMRLADQLIGCAVIDSIDHGLSATYTYFHPDFADRGPRHARGVVSNRINSQARLGLSVFRLLDRALRENELQAKFPAA